MTTTTDDETLSRGAQSVRSLLSRHGIPKHRHAAFVGEFFALSRAAAHQRVSKSTAWTLEELGALADHFGETLAGVVAPHPSNDVRGNRQAISATLCAGDAKVACRIWLRPGNAPSLGDVFVALRTGDDHVVMAAAAVPAAHALRISRLEVDQPVPVSARVAVLDASEKTTAILCGHLRAAGIDGYALGKPADLMNAAADETVAGCVIDWLAARSKIDRLLSVLQARQHPCALILLSDRKRATAADIADLARAVTQCKAQVLEQPVQVPLLISMLQSNLGT